MTRKRTYFGCFCDIALGEHLEAFGSQFDLTFGFFDGSSDLHYFGEVLHDGIFDQILDVKLVPSLGGKARLHDLV